VNNLEKLRLIHDTRRIISCVLKIPMLREGPIAYQLVGEVKAHQGNDGYRA
jgi:hypothetical protein